MLFNTSYVVKRDDFYTGALETADENYNTRVGTIRSI